MKTSVCIKALRDSLLTGISASVFLGAVVPSAKAGPIVNPGTDYLRTPAGGSRFCAQSGPNPGDPCALQLSFSGLPIGKPTAAPPDGGYSGQADTVVNRLNAVDPMKSPSTNPITGSADVGEATTIEIIGLSLKGDTEVPLKGISGMPDGSLYNYYAGLSKYYPAAPPVGDALSTGTMFIGDDGAKTWDSEFKIKGIIFFVPTSTPIVTGVDFVRTAIEHFTNPFPGSDPQDCNNTVYTAIKACLSFGFRPEDGPFKAFNYPWSYIPLPDQILGKDLVGAVDNNFYLTALDPTADPDKNKDGGLVIHEAPNHIHEVTPRLAKQAPSPLAILGVPAVAATVGRLKKLSSSLRQLKEII